MLFGRLTFIVVIGSGSSGGGGGGGGRAVVVVVVRVCVRACAGVCVCTLA